MLFKLCSEGRIVIISGYFSLGIITVDLYIFLNNSENISETEPEMRQSHYRATFATLRASLRIGCELAERDNKDLRRNLAAGQKE